MPCHKVEVVYVGRKPEVRVGTALVGGHHQFALLDLELHERQAGRLVAFGFGCPEEQHIVFGRPSFRIDPGEQRRQLLEIGGVGVDQDRATVVPPVYAGFAVLLHRALAAHEEPELRAQLLSGQSVPLENLKQVGWGKRELLVDKVGYVALLVGLVSAVVKNPGEDLVIFVACHFS